MNQSIAIIGGGMTAIYAYFAAKNMGFKSNEIDVFVNSIELRPKGAQFMYKTVIPWKPITLRSILLGDAEGYAEKQWGSRHIPTSVIKRFNGGLRAYVDEELYDPAELLPVLWGMVYNIQRIGLMEPEDLDKMKRKYSAVICSFPNPKKMKEYTAGGYLTAFPIFMVNNISNNYICMYNGDRDIPWVRQTIKPGYTYTEYPNTMEPQEVISIHDELGERGGVVVLTPELMHNTVSLSREERIEGNLLRVGRIATFDRSYLSHQAYEDTCLFLAERIPA